MAAPVLFVPLTETIPNTLRERARRFFRLNTRGRWSVAWRTMRTLHASGLDMLPPLTATHLQARQLLLSRDDDPPSEGWFSAAGPQGKLP